MAITGFGTVQPPSTPAAPASFTASVANPQLSVGNYVSQQLGAINSGVGAQTGQASSAPPSIQGQQDALGQKQNELSAAISDSNSRQLNLIQMSSEIKRRQQAALDAQRQASAQQPQASAPSVSVGGGGSMGQAYTPDGRLSAARNQALATASSYLGDRYVLGGTSHSGIDCSGLVMAVYDQFGMGKYLDSHLAGHQAAAVPGVRTSISNLRPGDLVCWNDGSHIAIYAGNGEIIEAANERVGTVKRKLWSNAVFGIALRLPGE